MFYVMLCYVTRCYNKLLYMQLWCWGGGGWEGEGDFRKLVAAESSAYPIPDAKFPYAISHFIYVILIPLLD